MTKLRWTVDKPTKEGWYWFSVHPGNVGKIIVELKDYGCGVVVDLQYWNAEKGRSYPIKYVPSCPFYWAGPIEGPGNKLEFKHSLKDYLWACKEAIILLFKCRFNLNRALRTLNRNLDMLKREIARKILKKQSEDYLKAVANGQIVTSLRNGIWPDPDQDHPEKIERDMHFRNIIREME